MSSHNYVLYDSSHKKWATDDLTPCPWTIEIPSLIQMSLRMGSIEKSVGKLLPLKNCTHGM